MVRVTAQALAAAALLSVAHARTCRTDLLSCANGKASKGVDPCCAPTPGGLFLFRQRFEPDVGSEGGRWGIDGVDVLKSWEVELRNRVCIAYSSCDGSPATTTFGPTYTHEEIASFSLKSHLFDDEGFSRAENEWAQSEVGEGVEEVWERAWNSAGRFISTQNRSCRPDQQPGLEVASFFHSLHKAHNRYPIQRILSEADITPAADTTYSLELLQSTLSLEGDEPIIICDNVTLSTVLWPVHVRGPFDAAGFEPAKTSRSSNCPKEGIIYPPSTTIPRPTETATWDPIHRPTPRPITLSHDESKMYYRPGDDDAAPREDPRKLKVFKAGDEGKEARGVKGAAKAFYRDEL